MSEMRREYEEYKRLLKLEAVRNKEIDFWCDLFKATKEYPFSLLFNRTEDLINQIPMELVIEGIKKVFNKKGCGCEGHNKMSDLSRDKIFSMFRDHCSNVKDPMMGHATAEPFNEEDIEKEVKETEEVGEKVEEEIQKEYEKEDAAKFIKIHDKFLEFQDDLDKTQDDIAPEIAMEKRITIQDEFINWLKDII